MDFAVRDARRYVDPPAAGLLRSLALLWLAGAALRLTILALPPALPLIGAEFHLLGSDTGILTAIPPLFFSLAAVPGAALISRVGPSPALLVGLLVNALGAAARGFTGGVFGLELATSVMCLGVAVMQPAMPTLVRSWTPARVGLASATYTCGLLCGEVLPILWPFAPHLPLIGGGWRSGLFVWSVPVLATVIVILALQPRARQARAAPLSRASPNWRRGSLWQVGLLLGAVNASYFGLNGFLPDWISQSGNSSSVRPVLLALNVAQIPASMLMMVLLDRFVFRRTVYVLAGLLVLAASFGLAAAPATFSVFFAAAAGFFLAILLTLALALPPLLVSEQDVSSFSAGVFTVSYAIAVLTALLTGFLVVASPSRLTSVLPIAAAALAVVAVGRSIRRPQTASSDVADGQESLSC